MKFTKNSALAKVWVGNVQANLYTKDQVPKIFNLQEVVWEVLEESTK